MQSSPECWVISLCKHKQMAEKKQEKNDYFLLLYLAIGTTIPLFLFTETLNITSPLGYGIIGGLASLVSLLLYKAVLEKGILIETLTFIIFISAILFINWLLKVII